MLSTKIHAPRQRDDLLVRPRLLAALAGYDARLVLVTGPAGAGKTVLVRQWFDRVDHPCAWLTLDARDNDPARFWTYVVAALAACTQLVGWPEFQTVGVESLDALADQLADARPLSLVLDDMHFLVDRQVLEQLDQLVEMLPARVRLVLISRARPQLRLARHQAAGHLVEVRGEDLLFSPGETEEVLGRPSRDVLAAAVQQATGGWPVAVAFSARLPEPGPAEPEMAHRAARTRQQLADYLTEEILRTQPDEVQSFLLDTSILDEITVTASNEIRGSTDAARHLGYLERHHVFLTPLDGTGVETWRHHALVRDHLRQTLERTEPERWADLHRRAAAHYASTDLERAIGHALTAPDPDLAADLIQRGANEPGTWSEWVPTHQLLRWLEALPDRVFTERADLRSLGLSAAATSVRPDLVDRWLAARSPESAASLEEMFAQAWRADVAGDMPAVRDACQRALQICEPGSGWWRVMHGGLAGAEYMLGHWDAAAESFAALRRQLRHSLTSSSGAQQENLRGFLAVIRAMQGDTAAAESALRELRDWLARATGAGYQSGGIAAWAEAMVAFYSGDVQWASRWVALPDDSAFVDQPLPPMVFRLDQARVRRSVGDSQQAAELLADVRRRLSGFADPGLMRQWVDEEETALGGGATAPAPPLPLPTPDGVRGGPVEPLSPREREILHLLRSEFSQPEIAAHLFVSYNTTKTHTRTIYRKLGVTSRSAAVARARALGYL
jgi:LuxR family maltose regulon positive regulatory protein